MTGDELARSYLAKAAARCRVLDVLFDAGAYSDVVREAQELVELVLKAALRLIGVDPPRVHDVGPVLTAQAEAYPEWFRADIERLSAISEWLRNERETSFYGDLDVIPTESYSSDDADRARSDAISAYEVVHRLLAERDEQQRAAPAEDVAP